MSARHFIKVDIKYSLTADTAASTGITVTPTRRVYDLVDPALTFKSFNILVRRCRLTHC
jgi:hypothetical protein